MSASSPVPSKKTKNGCYFNAFLFNITNQLTLDEFKKFTNFPELLTRAMNRKLDCAVDGKIEDNLLRKNYKRNVPEESKWRKGVFKDLKLTHDFYGSDVATRIFNQIYGLKKCVVNVNDAIQRTSRVDTISPDFDEPQELPSSSDVESVAKIDLTQTDDHESSLKMKIKYPCKRVNETPSTSGIATYKKFVDQIAQSYSPDDKVVVSSTESSIEMVHQRTVVPIIPKRMEIISDVMLVPPTPFRDAANQRQPNQPRSRPKIGPKSKVCQPSREQTHQQQPHHPKNVPMQSSLKKEPKPKCGPKSKVQQRTSRVVYVDEDSEELLQQMLALDAINETSQNVGSKRTEIHPKSNVNSPPVKSTQDLLHDLTYTEPTPIVKPIPPKPKPRIGPKSAMMAIKNTNTVHEQESLSNIPTPKPRTCLQDSSPNVAVPMPKPRIGPKSVMTNPRTSSPTELLKNLMHSIPSTTPQSMIFAQPKQKIDHKSRVKSPVRIVTTPLLTTAELVHDLSHTCPPLPARTDDGRIPEQTRELISQMAVLSQGEHLSKSIRISADSEAPTHCSESSELRGHFIRAFDTLMANTIPEYMTKYLAETDSKALSMKYFFCELLKSEYENDISAAETQLSSSITNDDVQLEAQSQVLLRQDQLEAADVDNIQMEVAMPHADPENAEKIEMEPQPSRTDPQPDEFIAEHSDPPVRVKIEDEHEGDHNETCSSDVQVIEVPPEEPIEISSNNTEELMCNLEVQEKSTQEAFCVPFTLPQLPIVYPSKKEAPVAKSSKRFLTSLPVIASKTRKYPPLEIVVEAAHKISPTEFPLYDFSQQPTPPSNENYEIEECTMTESQYQRYELLNNENSIFLSSQLDNYTGQPPPPPHPKSTEMHTDATKQPHALKRLSAETLNLQSCKRRRYNETLRRELNWRVMDIRSMAFKPLANNNKIFHLELQLRNNFDTYHFQEELSIKRLLNLTDKEWKIIGSVLTATNGHRYDGSTTALARRQLNLPSRIMDCFVQSISMFVRSTVHFKDFMGNVLEVSERQPLKDRCVDAAIDPQILIKMEELKKQLEKKQ